MFELCSELVQADPLLSTTFALQKIERRILPKSASGVKSYGNGHRALFWPLRSADRVLPWLCPLFILERQLVPLRFSPKYAIIVAYAEMRLKHKVSR